MKTHHRYKRFALFLTSLSLFCLCTAAFSRGHEGRLPGAIRRIMLKPRYSEATWALRAVDVKSGEVIYNVKSQHKLLTGSVRKLYSVGVTLNELGADYRFKTPVFRNGHVDGSGDLKGDLILVVKGDVTMGGRDSGDDTIATTDFDHCDANNLGSAILTKPDPLEGLNNLAVQVAASGIKKVSGDVIIDDRLFKEFRVPNQLLLITPIVINDNRIDVAILPAQAGEPAQVEWRPHTAAFQDPAAFARTAFIEALHRAGVTVNATLVAPNPSRNLPSSASYPPSTQVAELVSAPYAQYAKLILKVSHNLGANLSLMLFGLASGVNTMQDALSMEAATLVDQYGLHGNGFDFPTNGSGSPDSRASAATTVQLLVSLTRRTTFPFYFDSLPILGVDGSLAEIGIDSPARGKVFAKTGTFLDDGKIKAQVLAGYIHARSGRHLAYALFVNDAGEISDIADVIGVIQDEGDISAIIQQLN